MPAELAGSGMEFDEPVTLLQFTPLSDGYGASSYRVVQGMPSVERQGDIALYSRKPMSCPLQQAPYDYAGTDSCEVYGDLPMESSSTYQHARMHNSQPVPTLANSLSMVHNYEDFGDVLVTATSNHMSDLGPPPIRLHQLEAPMSVDLTVETNKNSLIHGAPNSPMSVRDAAHHRGYGFINRTFPKNRTKTPRGNVVMRSSSPMFPDQSTPLSTLSRQSSTNSITSARSSDQLSAYSLSVKSDPGHYTIHSATNSNSCDSAINSPAISMGQVSPRFEFSTVSSPSAAKAQASSEATSTQACLELEMPAKFARRIIDLDKKILKLQAERSKILIKAHQTKSSDLDPIASVDITPWLMNDKLPEVGKVQLYIFPLGNHRLDNPLYDDANRILRQVGGLYLDLQTAISILRSTCCKGVFILAEISTCFAYIKSLLQDDQKLKLSDSQGVYSIHLDSEGDLSDGMVLLELRESMAAANNVLKCAQHITNSYFTIQKQLREMRQAAAEKVDTCDGICQKLEIVDRERRSQIRSILEGNCTTMASAERLWPNYYQVATQTISAITECIHPSPTPSHVT